MFPEDVDADDAGNGDAGDDESGTSLLTDGAGDGDKASDKDASDDKKGDKGDKDGKAKDGDKEPAKEPAKDADDGKKGDDDGKKADGKSDAKPDGAPEEYAAFVMPEGVEVNKEGLEAFLPIAKELDLSQDQAQKLVGIQTKMLIAAEEKSQTDWASTKAEWRESAENDKEFGGEKLEESLVLIRDAMKEWGSPELEKLMKATGFGDHPAILRHFYHLGQMKQEDGFSRGGDAGSGERDQAKILFGKD